MARKNIARVKITTGQSLASSFQSPSSDVQYLDNVGVIIQTSGVSAGTGTFGIQVRDKIGDNPSSYSNWADLTLSGIPTMAGADQTIAIGLTQLPWSEFRVVYIASGGANGTVDIWHSIKQVGG